MQVLTYSEARSRLKDVMEQVTDNHDEVIVTRKNGKPVVMVSLEEWNAIQETMHLLASPANAQSLRASIAQLEAGHGGERALIDP
ncbi:type II toxin-antitoxin system prevent-host-death family antitoxin [Gluconacetobacter aggeris]|uniref:Antitoxin n=1 Tax=Gluconacetobacter aggeris TaxID=1286186 RepID=A0A7W4IRB8_9PROT|nr:type II toxin-antitoxin system prevent-host-death family antitoxin [Gluconacetobacter aggeris]MBB2167619.1 type II toxin-antitoxin system prevent-host-death family antitoxin [Gluconacetobacter aggeris]